MRAGLSSVVEVRACAAVSDPAPRRQLCQTEDGPISKFDPRRTGPGRTPLAASTLRRAAEAAFARLRPDLAEAVLVVSDGDGVIVAVLGDLCRLDPAQAAALKVGQLFRDGVAEYEAGAPAATPAFEHAGERFDSGAGQTETVPLFDPGSGAVLGSLGLLAPQPVSRDRLVEIARAVERAFADRAPG